MASENFKLGTAKLEEKLTGKDNFIFWKMKLERYLRIQDTADDGYFYHYVSTNHEPPNNLDANGRGRFQRSLARTLNFILNSLSQQMFLEVSHLDTARAVMDHLTLKYRPNVLDAI